MKFWDRLLGKTAPPEGQKSGLSASPEVIETWRMWGGPHGPYSQIYRRQPAVRTVVDFLARNIGSLNAKVYQRVGDDDRREIDRHPLAQKLRRPNDDTTRYRHMRDTVSDIAIFDRAFWWKQYRGGEIENLLRISPAQMDVSTDADGRRVYRMVGSGRVIPRDQLVIFPGYSPAGDDLGVSPMETLRRVLAEEWEAVQHRANMWRNAARQGTVLSRPVDAPEWGDPERTRFRSDWQAMMTGSANSGKTAILEDGMTASTLSAFNAKEMEYIAGRKLTYEEVALAYGGATLAALVVGQGADVKANVDSFHRQLYQDVLGPWLRMLQDEIELQLLSDFDVDDSPRRRIYVEFNLAEKLKGSFEEQASVLATSVGVPFMSINDGRSRLNMARIDNDMFDLPVMPLNVIYGGQQSTQEPTADPSTPPGLLSATPKTKAIPRAVQRRRDETAEQYEKLFRSHFERQERSLTASVKAKAEAPARWEKWTLELADDLFEASLKTTEQMGLRAAVQIGGVYDTDRTVNYLKERSRIASESINEGTRLAVEEALDAEDVDEALDHVFSTAKTSQAQRLGLTTATGLIAFARVEAGRHSQDADGKERTKTWIVTSAKSRHPQMNGETVPVGDTFSNGALWPGDSSLSTDETAGCNCLLVLN